MSESVGHTRRQWLGGAVLGLLAFASRAVCAEISSESRAMVALEEWHGSFGGTPEKSLRTIAREVDWQGFWRALDQPEPTRFVDGTNGAVVASLGARPTGGFGIALIDAVIRDDSVRLVLAEATPAKDAFVSQATTQPWAAFLLKTKMRTLDARWQDE
jgi:PrcB C-terminal